MTRSLIVAAMTLVPTLAPAADWPHFYGPHRDGHSDEMGFHWVWPKNGPPVAWTKDVGPGFAGVAVADRVVYLFHRVENDEILVACDAATGAEKWKFSARTKYIDDFGFDPGPRCVPVVGGGRIITLGPDGDLTAIDMAGKKLWRRNIRTEYAAPKGYFGVGAGPILLDGKLLVNVGGKGAGIVAFDPATGQELWKATDDPPGYSSPVAIGTGAAFFTRSGLVWVTSTGTVVHTHYWRPRLDASVNAASPIVHGNDVLLSTSYGTGAILLRAEGKKLEEVWSNDTSLSCHYNTPVKVGDYLYGIHGRQEGGGGKLRCVEWATGAVKWSVDRFGCASLIAVDGGLLAVTEGGDLVRFEASSKEFKEVARATILDGVVRAAPALSDGRLYIRNETKLVCVKLK